MDIFVRGDENQILIALKMGTYVFNNCNYCCIFTQHTTIKNNPFIAIVAGLVVEQ